jgi:hypothetical protein
MIDFRHGCQTIVPHLPDRGQKAEAQILRRHMREELGQSRLIVGSGRPDMKREARSGAQIPAQIVGDHPAFSNHCAAAQAPFLFRRAPDIAASLRDAWRSKGVEPERPAFGLADNSSHAFCEGGHEQIDIMMMFDHPRSGTAIPYTRNV